MMEHHQVVETAPTPYPFTAQQLARLSTYKAAVDAGFYSDAHAEASSFDGISTLHELDRLAIYRAAIKPASTSISRAERRWSDLPTP